MLGRPQFLQCTDTAESVLLLIASPCSALTVGGGCAAAAHPRSAAPRAVRPLDRAVPGSHPRWAPPRGLCGLGTWRSDPCLCAVGTRQHTDILRERVLTGLSLRRVYRALLAHGRGCAGWAVRWRPSCLGPSPSSARDVDPALGVSP